MASGRIYFVPSRTGRSSVTSAFDTPVDSTNLKYDFGNTKDSLCDRIELRDVNVQLVSIQAGLTSANTAPS